MSKERRRRRSQYSSIALSYQLEACAERAGLTAMLLARRDGLLVAGSPWPEEKSESVAASLAGTDPNHFYVGRVRAFGQSQQMVTARGFQSGGEELVMCAVGRPSENALREIYRAMSGASRILT